MGLLKIENLARICVAEARKHNGAPLTPFGEDVEILAFLASQNLGGNFRIKKDPKALLVVLTDRPPVETVEEFEKAEAPERHAKIHLGWMALYGNSGGFCRQYDGSPDWFACLSNRLCEDGRHEIRAVGAHNRLPKGYRLTGLDRLFLAK